MGGEDNDARMVSREEGEGEGVMRMARTPDNWLCGFCSLFARCSSSEQGYGKAGVPPGLAKLTIVGKTRAPREIRISARALFLSYMWEPRSHFFQMFASACLSLSAAVWLHLCEYVCVRTGVGSSIFWFWLCFVVCALPYAIPPLFLSLSLFCASQVSLASLSVLSCVCP